MLAMNTGYRFEDKSAKIPCLLLMKRRQGILKISNRCVLMDQPNSGPYVSQAL